jgi:sporulation protein YlmC with PRC-barrel domain
MNAATEFDIGSRVECTDGPVGHLSRVVLDPVARAITHIAVDPRSRRGVGHIVPIDYVASAGETVKLTTTRAQFEQFERAEETDFVRLGSGWSGYSSESVLSLPYYSRYAGTLAPRASATELTKNDYVPLGEVEVKRGDQVHCTDGPIGRVHGLVIDPSNHHVTDFLLEHGHLWGRRTISIPIGAVARVADDDVRLSLTKDQVRDLPPVELDRSA